MRAGASFGPERTTPDAMNPPLNAEQIRAGHGIAVEVHDCIESTQTLARERVAGGRRPLAIFAEQQLAGRGQRGRRWVSPRGAALYLTLVWPSKRRLADMAGLSLLVGLALRSALRRFGVEVHLKWPNDVWFAERKLAGILVELLADPPGSTALIGIGLNHCLPAEAAVEIDQAHIDLAAIVETVPERSMLAAALLAELEQHLSSFEVCGLGGFLMDWQAADALAGRPIWLVEGAQRSAGTALGIDALGRLKVLIDGRERWLAAGEVSIRPALLSE